MSDITTFVSGLTEIQASGPVFKLIKKLEDGYHEGYALVDYLNRYGKKSWSEGGNDVYWNIVKTGRRAKQYFGGTQLDTDTEEFLQPASLKRAYYNYNITYFKTDLLQNQSSPLKMVDFVSERITQGGKNFARTLELDILGDGTTSGDATTLTLQPVVGLANQVAEDPTTGTFAGISRSSSTTYANNQYLDISALNNLTTTDLMQMFQECSHDGMQPNVIFTNETAYRKIWTLAKGENWFRRNEEAAELGYPNNIEFNGAPIIPLKSMTSTANGGIVTTEIDRIYFLNVGEGLCLYVDPSDNMNMGPVLQPTDQHVLVQHMTWNGQLVTANPRLNGVIFW